MNFRITRYKDNFKKTVTKYFLCLTILVVVANSCKNNVKKCEDESEKAVSFLLDDKKIDELFDKTVIHVNNAWPEVKEKSLLPRSMERGYRKISDWTSGFYPGCLWMAYEYGKDEAILEKAKYATELLEEEKYNTKDHDIGFRIYCSYGRAFDATKNPEYKAVIIQAAESAIARFDPKVGVIMSWNPKGNGFKTRNWQYPVIIDNMMNLELLFAAAKFTGDKKYYDIAVKHADKTMEYQYRDDFSCSHVVDYDSITGVFRRKDWNNGNNDPVTAAWSRGQSWGLYGYTLMYRETGDKKYLKHAENISSFILNHPNMPKDMVPIWDYSGAKISKMRDASAAAILASGLFELSELSKENGSKYFKEGKKIIESLSSPKYFAEPGTNGNFLIKHATGNYLRDSEKDGTLIYADYYFLEALLRYKRLKNTVNN